MMSTVEETTRALYESIKNIHKYLENQGLLRLLGLSGLLGLLGLGYYGYKGYYDYCGYYGY